VVESGICDPVILLCFYMVGVRVFETIVLRYVGLRGTR